MIKRILSCLAILLMHFALFAQDNGVEMADTMRSNGKIYVVVAVIVAIFIGIILYLIRLDRKITRLEKDIHSKI
jgi:CcmD family protein